MISTKEPEPTADKSADFWDKPDRTLRTVLRPFVDDPKTLVTMTRVELQAELRKLLEDSAGA